MLADVGDPEGEEEPVEPGRTARLDLPEQVVRGLLREGPPPPLRQAEQPLHGEVEQVLRAADESVLHEFRGGHLADPRQIRFRVHPRQEALERLAGFVPRCLRVLRSGSDDGFDLRAPLPDPGHQAPGGLLVEGAAGRPGRDGQQRLPGQPVQVRRGGEPPDLHQHLHEFRPQALDLHPAPAHEVEQPGVALRRTVPPVPAGVVRPVGHHRSGALGTDRRHRPGLRTGLPPRRDDLHHLRNHIPGALHPHPVAGPGVEGTNQALVVEGRPADGDAGDDHRLQVRHRRQLPGAADLHRDPAQDRFFRFRREFERRRPARAPGPLAEFPLVEDPVHLDHRPVEFHRQFRTRLEQPPPVVERRLRPDPGLPPDLARPGDGTGAPGGGIGAPRRRDGLGGHEEPEIGQRPQPAALGLRRRRLRIGPRLPDQDVVGEQRERAAGGDPGVELPDRAGGGVPRIPESRLPRFLEAAVHLAEILHREHHLAPDREPPRRHLPAESERERTDRPQVGSDVLPDAPVAAGRAAPEGAVLVHQFHREAVELGLEAVGDPLPADLPLHAVGEFPHLRFLQDALEREERLQVLHFGEPFGDAAGDPLRGRVRVGEGRVLALEVEQFPEQPVVLGVADLRGVPEVVGAVVVFHLRHERPVPLAQPLRLGHPRPPRRRQPRRRRFCRRRSAFVSRSVTERAQGRSRPSTASPASSSSTPCSTGRNSPTTPSASSRNPHTMRTRRQTPPPRRSTRTSAAGTAGSGRGYPVPLPSATPGKVAPKPPETS